MLASALIHLYPRAWRERYGREMADLLASQGMSLRTVADLVAGAIDARFSPQRVAQQSPVTSGGAMESIKRSVCNAGGLSTQDQWRSAGWMAGGSLALSAFAVLLKMQIGPNSLSEGLIYSAFPASMMLSSECTYLRRYSRRARTAMSVGGAIFVVLVTWAAAAIGERI
jgi:hypothetical protein